MKAWPKLKISKIPWVYLLWNDIWVRSWGKERSLLPSQSTSRWCLLGIWVLNCFPSAPVCRLCRAWVIAHSKAKAMAQGGLMFFSQFLPAAHPHPRLWDHFTLSLGGCKTALEFQPKVHVSKELWEVWAILLVNSLFIYLVIIFLFYTTLPHWCLVI